MKIESFYNHNEKEVKHYLVVSQRNGNDRNGNPIYIVNIFDAEKLYLNYNYSTGRKLDKYGNIRMVSYSLDADIQSIINNL